MKSLIKTEIRLQKRTDSNGFCAFDYIAPGRYKLSTWMDDYPVQHKNLITTDCNKINVKIELKKIVNGSLIAIVKNHKGELLPGVEVRAKPVQIIFGVSEKKGNTHSSKLLLVNRFPKELEHDAKGIYIFQRIDPKDIPNITDTSLVNYTEYNVQACKKTFFTIYKTKESDEYIQYSKEKKVIIKNSIPHLYKYNASLGQRVELTLPFSNPRKKI